MQQHNNLIPWFPINGKGSYPDDASLFRNMQAVEFNDETYWLCLYLGEQNLETGIDTYATYSAAVNPVISEFTTANEQVTVNGNPTQGFQQVYFGVSGDSLVMTLDVVDSNGVKQTQLDSATLGYPPVLSLPLLKVVNGDVNSPVDEVYFSTTLVNGVITVNGVFTASGDWKLLTNRINAALAQIGANWILTKEDTTFRINA